MQPLTIQQAECIRSTNEDLIGEKLNGIVINDLRIDKLGGSGYYIVTVIYTPTTGTQMPSETKELEEFCIAHNYLFRKGDCFDKQ